MRIKGVRLFDGPRSATSAPLRGPERGRSGAESAVRELPNPPKAETPELPTAVGYWRANPSGLPISASG